MQMYGNYISPLGYQNGDNGIDSYGVNHNGFSTRDELAYQTARQKRENQIMQNYNTQGIISNYPQYSTNFWGNSAVNNYGFGTSNIENNIENILDPLDNTSNQGIQYAQNNLANIASDVEQTSKFYRIGTLSGLYESTDNPAAIGVDNSGGPSYGAYQIATTPGTMNNYINFLQQIPQYQSFADILNKAGGNIAAIAKSPSFVNAWQQLSKNKDFNASQYNFIINTHLNPLINAVKEKDLLNLDNRHPVVKDALYSMSVQHRAAPQIVNKALQELKQQYGSNPLNIDDTMILRSLYKNRADYVKALPESQHAGDKKITRQEKMNIINKRYPKELQDALSFLSR